MSQTLLDELLNTIRTSVEVAFGHNARVELYKGARQAAVIRIALRDIMTPQGPDWGSVYELRVAKLRGRAAHEVPEFRTGRQWSTGSGAETSGETSEENSQIDPNGKAK